MIRNLNLFKNDLISINELKKEISKIDETIRIKENEISELSSYIKQDKAYSTKVNNLNILKEIIHNFKDEDREDMKKLFKLMIKEIFILNKDEVNKYNDDIKLKIILK